MNKEELLNEIQEKEEELNELKEEYEELENNENEDEYDQMLDNVYGTFKIGVCEFSASRVLSELDPIAYNCGMNDFNDERMSELENEINEVQDEIKELQEQLKEV